MTLPGCKDLSTGFTKNFVQTDGYQVFKIGPTVPIECKWYRAYRDKNDIPKIYNADPGGMTMEFIPTDGTFSLDAVLELIEKYKEYPRLNDLPFDIYRYKIAAHLKENPIHGGEKLLEALKQLDLPATFCHGDLSIQNIITNIDGPKLIDPLYKDDAFGSYWLDYAKLAFTLKFYNGDVSTYNDLMSRTRTPQVLIASECVRVATYRNQFNFISENLINEL